MRFLALPLLVTLAASALAQNSVDGRWKVTSKSMPPNVSVTMNFSKGKMGMSMSGPQAGRQMKMMSTGTYTFKGNALNTKFTDVKLDSSGMSAEEKKKFMSPQVQSRLKQMILRNPGPSGTVRFMGKDKFELKGKQGEATVFTRIR